MRKRRIARWRNEIKRSASARRALALDQKR
jgi:hypothetical protein